MGAFAPSPLVDAATREPDPHVNRRPGPAGPHRRRHALPRCLVLRTDADRRRAQGHRVQCPIWRSRSASRPADDCRTADADSVGCRNRRDALVPRQAETGSLTSASSWLPLGIRATFEPAIASRGSIEWLPNVPTSRSFSQASRAMVDELVTAGGRVLTVVGSRRDVRCSNRARLPSRVELIHFDGMQFRRDIGRKALAAR